MKVSTVHVFTDEGSIHINKCYGKDSYYYTITRRGKHDSEKIYESGAIDGWMQALGEAVDYVENEL